MGQDCTTAIAATAINNARAPSTTIITRSRRYRSPGSAMNGAASPDGTIRIRPSTPTARAPPTEKAYTARATVLIQSAVTERLHAISSRLRLGTRNASANEPSALPNAPLWRMGRL